MINLDPHAFIGLILVLGSTYALMRCYNSGADKWLGWLMVLCCAFVLIYVAG